MKAARYDLQKELARRSRSRPVIAKPWRRPTSAARVALARRHRARWLQPGNRPDYPALAQGQAARARRALQYESSKMNGSNAESLRSPERRPQDVQPRVMAGVADDPRPSRPSPKSSGSATMSRMPLQSRPLSVAMSSARRSTALRRACSAGRGRPGGVEADVEQPPPGEQVLVRVDDRRSRAREARADGSRSEDAAACRARRPTLTSQPRRPHARGRAVTRER